MANSGSGRRWRSGGSMMSAGAGAARATGSSTTDRKIRSTYSGGALPRSRSAAAAAALNDHQNLADLTILAALTRPRARRSPIAASSDADRPARAAWAAPGATAAGRRRPFLFSSPSGLAGPAAHETLLLCGRVVGTEVGILLVRLSPLFSWTRGSWSTSDCRHGPSSAPEHAS